MTGLKWVIQNNMDNDRNVGKLAEFLDAKKVEWTHIAHIPFDDSPVSGVDPSGITIFYGSTGLVNRVSSLNLWKPGVFFNAEKLSFNGQLQGYGSELLNSDSKLFSVRDLVEQDLEPDQAYFVRPAHDSKAFTGDLFNLDEIKGWKERLVDAKGRFTLDTIVQVAKPKVILREMRSFVVDGKVSTSSYYGHGMMRQEPYPEDVEYAKEMAKVYQPAEVFTLDTCLLESGERRVVENNCFNSSGLYWSDVYKLVQDVNNFLRERYT